MQEQDDCDQPNVHAVAVREHLQANLHDLIDDVVRQNSQAAALHMATLKANLASLWLSFQDQGELTFVEINSPLVRRFTDKSGKDTLLTISPACGARAYKRYGLYIAKVFLGTDYEITAEGFTLEDLKADLTSLLFDWWFHFEIYGWDDSPLANDLRKWFHFTATDIPEVTRD